MNSKHLALLAIILGGGIVIFVWTGRAPKTDPFHIPPCNFNSVEFHVTATPFGGRTTRWVCDGRVWVIEPISDQNKNRTE
jgi:hypothetical protein